LKLSIVLSLCGSLALGGAALLVARVWLPTGTSKAHANTLPDMHLVPVVVASGPLPYGTKLEPGKLAVVQYPASAVPAGAFSSLTQVMTQDHGGAPLVLTAMAPQEAVLPAKITGPGARASVAIQITEGMRAYALAVTDATGLGGNVLPGDWVDVIMTRQTDPDRPDKGLISQVVVQNVRVLGLDLNADPASTQTAVRHTATLEVKPEDAQKVALASQLGALSLSLRHPGSAETVDARLLKASDVAAPGTRSVAAGAIGHAPATSAPRKVATTAGQGSPQAPLLMPPPAPPHVITINNGGVVTHVAVPTDRAASGVLR